jgi:hypothetical protein
MTELKEHDAMVCRACGNEERASEGYPCTGCGTFLCVICNMKGITMCKACSASAAPAAPPVAGQPS